MPLETKCIPGGYGRSLGRRRPCRAPPRPSMPSNPRHCRVCGGAGLAGRRAAGRGRQNTIGAIRKRYVTGRHARPKSLPKGQCAGKPATGCGACSNDAATWRRSLPSPRRERSSPRRNGSPSPSRRSPGPSPGSRPASAAGCSNACPPGSGRPRSATPPRRWRAASCARSWPPRRSSTPRSPATPAASASPRPRCGWRPCSARPSPGSASARPGIALTLRAAPFAEGLRLLVRGESDLHCGGDDPGDPLPAFLRRERFPDITAGIVAAEGHPLLDGTPAPGDLAAWPWIDFDAPALDRLLVRLFRDTGRRAATVLRAGAAGLFAMATGPWLAWLPLDYLDRLAAPRLRPLPLAFGRRRCRTASSPGAPPRTWSRSACSNGRCATARSGGLRRRPGSSGAVLLLQRERGFRPAAPVDWSEGLTFHRVTSGLGAAAFLCPSGHRMGLRQGSNPRVSSALIARFGRIGSHESQDHWNHKRALVTLTLDDGRSSQARSRAFVAASKSTMPHALGAKTPIATLHLQLVGQLGLGQFPVLAGFYSIELLPMAA